MSKRASAPIAIMLATAIAPIATSAEPGGQDDPLIVRLVDASGNPIAGARVGPGAHGKAGPQDTAWTFYSPHARSDADGKAALPGLRAGNGEITLYALEEDRKLAGFLSIPREQLGGEATLTLEPACRVAGRLESSGTAKLGRGIGWTNAYIHLGKNRPISCNSEARRCEFYLPPGSYELQAYGTNLESVRRPIEIAPGRGELDLGAIDLPPTKLATLVGKPAPELERITGWKNGGPIKLADLRGKVVVLDFWGHWCGPCLRSMPGLMALHDAYADRGLVVIAVHDDSVDSISRVDKLVAGARDRLWGGRDLPFLVALDGEGATTAAYDVQSFPTALLIDQEGRLVGEIGTGLSHEQAESEIAKLLGLEGEAPAWRGRFDRAYRLGPEEALRRIPAPFIPERTAYITREMSAQGAGKPPAQLIFRWDGQLHRVHSGPSTLIGLLNGLGAGPSGLATDRDLFDCPEELERLDIPGDWVVREGSSLEDRLRALEPILRDELRLPVRFERRRVERDVVVASGKYELHPKAKDRPMIHITADDKDLNSVIGGGSGPPAEFLATLSHLYGLRFLDEAEWPGDAVMAWEQHDSSLDHARLPEILRNLSKQTSLEFRREVRPVDVWAVIKE